MHWLRDAVMVAIVAVACLHTAAAAERLAPGDIQAQAGGFIVAPGVVLGAGTLLGNSTGLTLQQCATLCNDTNSTAQPCQWFEHCATQSGCNMSQPVLAYQDCLLYTADCSDVEYADVLRQTALRATGFPLRSYPVPLVGYSAQVAQGVDDGGVECPGTAVPGKCAFASLLDATTVCAGLSECQGVVLYSQGIDGCSSSVAVLVVNGSGNSSAAFVSPNVATYTKQDAAAVLDANTLLAAEAQVVLPGEADAATAAAAGDASRDSWLGCIVAEGAIMAGRVVAVLDGLASPDACCRACRNSSQCDVWNFCAQPQGCSYNVSDPSPEPSPVALQQGQCELRFQAIASPSAGFAMRVKAKGLGMAFVGGAPLSASAPLLPGFTQLVGRLPQDSQPDPCDASILPELEQCVLAMPLQGLADYCQGSDSCDAIAVKQGFAGQQPGDVIGFIKSDLNSTPVVLAPSALLYVKDSGSPAEDASGGSLSSGAIAGIAVGAVAVAVLAAAAAFVLLRRRSRVAGGRARAGGAPATGSGLKVQEDGSTGGPHSSGCLGCCCRSAYGASDTHLSSASAGTLASWSLTGGPQGQPGTAPGSLGTLPPTSGGTGAPLRGRAVEVSSGAASYQSQYAAVRVAPAAVSPFATAASAPFGTAAVSPFAPAASAPFGAAAVSPFAPAASAPFALAGPASNGSAAGTPRQGDSRAPVASDAAAPGSAPASAADAVHAGGGGGGSWPGPDARPAPPRQQGGALQELQQHVAACDMLASACLDNLPVELATPHPPSGPAALPKSLREWVVDSSAVTYLRWPNGRLQELGTGASGRVIKASYLGETIAAKEIDLGRSPETHHQFVQEALRLHQLRHPHVVGLYGVCVSGSLGVLLLEHCGGRDLYGALGLQAAGSQQRLFGWRMRGRRIAFEVAKALAFLHAKGVVHMDVKSSNVLLTGNGTAKLADVGLARLQTKTFLSEVTMVGTFAWIAPEVLMGSPHCTSAVDLYSYGVLLWEIITGERPQRGALRMPRVPEECPQAVSDLMLRCLSQEASARPTARQVVQQLESMDG